MGPSSMLPHGLTEPLHYPSPVSLSLLATLLALGLGLLLWWWRRRSKATKSALGTPRGGTGGLPGRPAGLLSQIDTLKGDVLQTGDYRAGCHALALLLRNHFARKRGSRLDVLTAREIGVRLSDLTLGSLFELVADLQFRRRLPSRSEFEGVCELASEAAKKKFS